MFRKKHKRLSSVTVGLRQIVPSVVIAERKNVIYKCTATTCNSKKVDLGLTEGELKKQRYYDHVKSFKNEFFANSTTLSSYVWEIKKRKCSTSSYIGSLTNCENILQYNKKVLFMPP